MRHKTLLFACCAAILGFSCKNSSSEQARYFDDGRKKPSIVVVPVIDSSGQKYPWNVSNELTDSLKEKIVKQGSLYLADEAKSNQLFQQLGQEHNPFGKQIDWIKQNCPAEDYAIFLELIEHEEIPLTTRKNEDPSRCSSQLNISLRVRVIDLRSAPNKIILQEILHDQHHIPKQFTKFHFHQESWGEQGFPISPIGLAHAKLIREVSSRIEEYIQTSSWK